MNRDPLPLPAGISVGNKPAGVYVKPREVRKYQAHGCAACEKTISANKKLCMSCLGNLAEKFPELEAVVEANS